MVGWRTTLYMIFALLAAPVEFHVQWGLPYLRGAVANLWTAAIPPLEHGLLYYYSVIMAVETLFRLEMHNELAQRRGWQFAKVFAGLLVIPFLIYLAYGPDKPLPAEGVRWQIYASLAALILSVGVHFYISKVTVLQRHTAAS